MSRDLHASAVKFLLPACPPDEQNAPIPSLTRKHCVSRRVLGIGAYPPINLRRNSPKIGLRARNQRQNFVGTDAV